MKRYHVLAITFIAGVVCGLALSFSAHANTQDLICKQTTGKGLRIASRSEAQGEKGFALYAGTHTYSFHPLGINKWVDTGVPIGKAWAESWANLDIDTVVFTFTNSKNEASIIAENHTDKKIILNATNCEWIDAN